MAREPQQGQRSPPNLHDRLTPRPQWPQRAAAPFTSGQRLAPLSTGSERLWKIRPLTRVGFEAIMSTVASLMAWLAPATQPGSRLLPRKEYLRYKAVQDTDFASLSLYSPRAVPRTLEG